MNFAIRYLTEYDYDADVVDNLNALRVKPARQRPPALRRVQRAARPRGPPAPPHRLLRHRGGRVRGLAPAPPADDRRPRAGRAPRPAPSRRRPPGTRCASPPTARPAASSCSRPTTRPATRALDELLRDDRPASTPLATCCSTSRADPRPLRVPPRRHLRRLDDRRPARGRRRRLPGLRAPRAVPAAPPRDRRPLRLGLPVRGRRPTTATSRSRSTPTPGSRRCCPVRGEAASRSGSAPTRPTACLRRRDATSRSATAATTPTCRRSRASTAAPPRPSSRRA